MTSAKSLLLLRSTGEELSTSDLVSRWLAAASCELRVRMSALHVPGADSNSLHTSLLWRMRSMRSPFPRRTGGEDASSSALGAGGAAWTAYALSEVMSALQVPGALSHASQTSRRRRMTSAKSSAPRRTTEAVGVTSGSSASACSSGSSSDSGASGIGGSLGVAGRASASASSSAASSGSSSGSGASGTSGTGGSPGVASEATASARSSPAPSESFGGSSGVPGKASSEPLAAAPGPASSPSAEGTPKPAAGLVPDRVRMGEGSTIRSSSARGAAPFGSSLGTASFAEASVSGCFSEAAPSDSACSASAARALDRRRQRPQRQPQSGSTRRRSRRNAVSITAPECGIILPGSTPAMAPNLRAAASAPAKASAAASRDLSRTRAPASSAQLCQVWLVASGEDGVIMSTNCSVSWFTWLMPGAKLSVEASWLVPSALGKGSRTTASSRRLMPAAAFSDRLSGGSSRASRSDWLSQASPWAAASACSRVAAPESTHSDRLSRGSP
mmetsp:Transcript_91568/g.283250  ORF Transcript_91568/g.283250 Transcript_91568/m.283250 type:complete len:502 (+) Transcript_91568:860-2365(+)